MVILSGLASKQFCNNIFSRRWNNGAQTLRYSRQYYYRYQIVKLLQNRVDHVRDKIAQYDIVATKRSYTPGYSCRNSRTVSYARLFGTGYDYITLKNVLAKKPVPEAYKSWPACLFSNERRSNHARRLIRCYRSFKKTAEDSSRLSKKLTALALVHTCVSVE